MADPETVLRTTATIPGWPEIANQIIQATPKDRLLDFRLKWREPQPCWVSAGGRVVQIGDAAHTFLPSSGNGATQGIEDAISLSTCLKIAGRENIPWATRVHNKLRSVSHLDIKRRNLSHSVCPQTGSSECPVFKKWASSTTKRATGLPTPTRPTPRLLG